MNRRLSIAVPLLITSLVAFPAASGLISAADVPDFNREVRPILSRHCFKCHGPDEGSRKSRLRLDERDAAMKPAKSGAIALVPGKPEESELVKRIFTHDEQEIMPPPGTKDSLTDSEREVLKNWVASGGDYHPHWAFVPPQQAPLPLVRQGSWPRNAIDYFVLARLEKEGLQPSPPADRQTLARRLSLDLIGLPPTPAEADAFAADPSPDAYEKLVDTLLASPRYGERWARRWMDLARYADSNGYEKDRERSIWPWRDWVIRALNADMPFDQFTLEQLAGDMLPHATIDQKIATGFHRNTMLNEEGGIDPLEFRFNAMTDRVGTTGATWLGLTVGCAQCHTHKYDPIQHREYYQLMAFLNNADEPDLDLPQPEATSKERERQERMARLLAELPQRYPLESGEWVPIRPLEVEAASGEKGRVLEDGSVLFAGPSPDKDRYTLVVETDAKSIGSFRLEALIDDALPSKGPGRVAHGNFVLTEIGVSAAPRDGSQPLRSVKIVSGKADIEQQEFPITRAFDGKMETGWAVDADKARLNTTHSAVFQLEKPVEFPGGTRLVFTLHQQYGGKHTIGRPRLSLESTPQQQQTVESRRREAIEKKFSSWLSRERARTVEWTTLRPVEATSNLPLLTVEPDDSIFVSGDISKNDIYKIRLSTTSRPITAIRLEALPDDRLPHHGPGMAYYEGPKGDFFMGEFQVKANGKAISFTRATESYARNNFGSSASAALAVDGDPQTGWSTAGREGERHEAVFVPSEPIAPGAELQVTMMFGRHYACSLGRFRISATSQPGGAEARDLDAETIRLLRLPDAQLTQADRQSLLERCLLSLPELASTRREIDQLRKPQTHPITLVLRERPASNPRPTFIHKRGEFLQPTDRVEPGVIEAIAPFPSDLPRNRIGLARWLVSTNNPLTARVTVNRQWQAFFARGLVRTTEDFGYQGELPSHPELLDWLSVEFMKQRWSLKSLHKQIVMSATYQQSSRGSAELLQRDPENRLLARGPRVRLEAEVVRDSALKASGLLSEKMGGPSVYPPQPSGVTEVAYGSPGWPTSSGEDRYRRSVYTFMKRTAPFAMFNTFDAPTGEACVARRDVSNTPLQALTLLNDVFFVEVSQAMGRELAARPESVEARITEAFRRCLIRPPSREEVEVLTKFLGEQRHRLASGELDSKAIAGAGSGKEQDPIEQAAWTTVARAILNLDETIVKN